MATRSLAKQAAFAFGLEKPHSSVSELVEILTGTAYEDESYEGIPELVESINLQPTGPAEASRAIRKKLKHGDAHRQYRALVLLKALVDNGGQKFQTTFADGQLTDAIKHLASDPGTDAKVKRKLLAVLASWQRQFQGDPRMSLVANLYKSVSYARASYGTTQAGGVHQESEYERRKREQREAKQKAKQAKVEEKQREEQELRKGAERARRRAPFDFEKEKTQVFNSIAETSQAANNLVNALKFVNPEKERVEENQHVQECLERAKQARKRIVRYIQLVENEEVIGTLIDTNERVIAALQQYDLLLLPDTSAAYAEEARISLAAVSIHHSGEVVRLQEKQRAAVERSMNRGKEREEFASPPSSTGIHPDLHDLDFGEIGSQQSNLPPPLRPSAPDSDDENDRAYVRGSLSDYSDYDSSDEERHKQRVAAEHARSSHTTSSTEYGAGTARHNYVNVSEESFNVKHDTREGLLAETDDPFADPFADQDAIVTPGIASSKAAVNQSWNR